MANFGGETHGGPRHKGTYLPTCMFAECPGGKAEKGPRNQIRWLLLSALPAFPAKFRQPRRIPFSHSLEAVSRCVSSRPFEFNLGRALNFRGFAMREYVTKKSTLSVEMEYVGKFLFSSEKKRHRNANFHIHIFVLRFLPNWEIEIPPPKSLRQTRLWKNENGIKIEKDS